MAELMQRMDAEELTQWVVWMEAEQVGPAWDRLRHCQATGTKFEDPWITPSAMTREQHVSQIEGELDAMAIHFGG